MTSKDEFLVTLTVPGYLMEDGKDHTLIAVDNIEELDFCYKKAVKEFSLIETIVQGTSDEIIQEVFNHISDDLLKSKRVVDKDLLDKMAASGVDVSNTYSVEVGTGPCKTDFS